MLINTRTKGFSLVELMLTLAVSVVLMLGIYKVYTAFVETGFDNLQRVNLHSQLETAMGSMTRELRRATTEVSYTNFNWDTNMVLELTDDVGDVMVITPGNPVSFPVVNIGDIGPILGAGPAYGNGRVQIDWYNGNGASGQGTVLTAFENLPPNGRLQSGEWFVVEPGVQSIGTNTRVLSGGNCVLFTYDADKNLQIDTTAGNSEQFGFRLQTDSGVGKIQKRTGGDFTDCTTGDWEDMTDNNIVNVTALNFAITNNSVSGDNGGTINRPQIVATVTGELVTDASVNKTLTKTISVRNDQYVAS